jgi:hypothetical protein
MIHQHAEAGKLTLDDIRDLENSVRNVRTRRGKDAKEMTADIEVLVVDAVADLSLRRTSGRGPRGAINQAKRLDALQNGAPAPAEGVGASAVSDAEATGAARESR